MGALHDCMSRFFFVPDEEMRFALANRYSG
jgi:hypothetical protein